MNPEAIPTKLNTTWKRVKVDSVMPKIMGQSFQNQDVRSATEELPTNYQKLDIQTQAFLTGKQERLRESDRCPKPTNAS
jgi:hypothetical protein